MLHAGQIVVREGCSIVPFRPSRPIQDLIATIGTADGGQKEDAKEQFNARDGAAGWRRKWEGIEGCGEHCD